MELAGSQDRMRDSSIKAFVGGVVLGIGAVIAEAAWMLNAAMGHGRLKWMPLLYSGWSALLLAGGLFIVSAHRARRWPTRKRWFEGVAIFLATVCLVFGAWGIWSGLDYQRAERMAFPDLPPEER